MRSSYHRFTSVRAGVVTGLALAIGVLGLLASPGMAQADFGLVAGSVRAESLNADGTADTLAGSHPYSFTLHFELRTEENGLTEGGEARDAVVDLPPGFVGNATAVPECTHAQFEGGTPKCPPDTQIGILRADVTGLGEIVGPVFNLTPPPGYVAEIAFSTLGFQSVQYISVNTEGGYGLHIVAPDFPLPPTSVAATIWGTPAESSHDAQRTEGAINGGAPVPSEAPLLPYLTLPTTCSSAAPSLSVEVDSELAPGLFTGESGSFVGSGGLPAPIGGCEAVPFSPGVSSLATSKLADSPSGLDFALTLPDQGLLGRSSISETEPEKVEVALPAGMTLDPSAANGIVGCSPAQYAATNGEPGHGCPESSKLGSVLAKTPLLGEGLEGSVYLAAPHDNPFNSLLALYIVARAPERGLLIKLAGDVHADPVTGQLTAVFEDLPPISYSLFELKLHEGPRAPLTLPQTCGTYSTQAKLFPFTEPGTPVEVTSPFKVTAGAGGGACAPSEAGLPNAPSLAASSVTPLAGSYSPFVLNLTREDGSQRLDALNVALPAGLTGKLAGVARCSDAQIAAAAARQGYGQGALEQASPSCPAASELGTVTVGAGSGTPVSVSGHAYLAGPYKGAPFSIAIITPAIAGPFDLGTVVVRAGLYINPETAQVTVKSDPLPTILEGIPLDIRSVSIAITRPEFMINPTSCTPSTVNGEALSTLGQTAALSNRFQVGGCAGLPFKPGLTAATQAKTSKANGASLTIAIGQKSGEANIHKVQLEIPKTLPTRLTTLQQACTEAQFSTNPAGCPAGSYIGTATANTPLLAAPLVGPAVLVSHGGAAFPDVEFLLSGEGINVTLDGKTDIKGGVTYSRFETVPDVPISSFQTTLPEGPHSILTATGNLCQQTLGIPTTIVGQNGAVLQQETPVNVQGCPNALYVTSRRIKNGVASITVDVPSGGRLVATGSGLNSGAVKATKARQNVTVKLTLTSKERSFLSRHKGRRLKAKIHLRFRPASGRQLTAVTTVLIG